MSKLKRMTIVIADKFPTGNKYPWKKGEGVLYLGEITNMPGHGAFVTSDGVVHWGYHLDVFREATEEEV